MSDDKRLQRMEDKVDQVVTTIGAINVTLAGQHESLKEHIRRTNIIEAELKPIKTHVDRVSGAIKLLSVLATVLTIIEAIRLFK